MFFQVKGNTGISNLAVQDFLPLEGTDYVEFYVGNAKQSAHYYKTAFGFQSVAYSGPENGNHDTASYVLRQNKLTFVFTTPLKSSHPIAQHIFKHGDGIKVLALRVPDATNSLAANHASRCQKFYGAQNINR